MANIYGEINLIVSVPVENETEELGLMEANYKFNHERLIAYELVAIDCKGERHKMTVHDCNKLELDEFIG